MNWFEKIEQKRTLIIGGLILICLALLILTVRRNNVSFDSFWHLKMGLDWLEHDLNLWKDHFSFTFNGKEISHVPYMFQILLGLFVTQFGLELGFELFKFFSFFLTFTLAVLFLRKLNAPTIIFLLVLPLVVVLLQFRSIVRPELISYSFSIIAMIFYYRAANKISTMNMLSIVVLMWVWSNYHSSIFGYIIFFGLFLDLALDLFRQRAPFAQWAKWSLWGLLIVGVGFLKPGFNHPVIAALTFTPEWKNLILEYQSALDYRNVPAIYSLIIVYLMTLVLLLQKRQFGLFFVCAILIYYSFNIMRLVTPGGIVILCAFAWAVSKIDIQRALQHRSSIVQKLIGASVIVVFIISLTSSVIIARSYMKENRLASLFPVDVANYMQAGDISGRIFNDYGSGGYLSYRFSPESQVYIDGRTEILYTLEHFYDYSNALRSPGELAAEIEKYDINLALLNNEQRIYTLVHDTGMLTLDFVGARHSLFRKNDANFPVLGTLLASPACWNEEMTNTLGDEETKAKQLLPPNSYLQLSLVGFMLDYSKASDKSGFLTRLQMDEQWSDNKLRFAAYQALSNDLDARAKEFFSEISEKEFSDFLGIALVQARLNEWQNAEQTLDDVTRQVVSFRPSEFRILHDLLVKIGENFTLRLFDNAYIEGLAVNKNAEEESISPMLPTVGDFCPEPYVIP